MLEILIMVIVLLAISFLLALRSMKDFDTASHMRRGIEKRKTKGSIVFFDDRVGHYHSSSSSSN